MPPSAKLLGNALQLTDSSENVTNLGFSDEHVTCESTTNIPSGIQSRDVVRIRNNGEYNILTNFQTIRTVSIQLNDKTGEEFRTTLTAPILSANTTLSLPPTPPYTNSFVQLDPLDTTKVKWSAPQATPVSQELAWMFGTVKQLWSLSNGDPFNDLIGTGEFVIPPKLPITRSSGTPGGVHLTRAAGLPQYTVSGTNIFHLQVLTQTANKQAIISWDQSTSPTQWEFRTSLRMDHSVTSGGKSFTLFGNGTAQSISVANSVVSGALANQSGGIAVEFDTGVSPLIIRVWEDQTNAAEYSVGTRIGFDPGFYRVFKLQRKDRVLRIEVFSTGDSFDDSHHVVIEHTLQVGFEPTGTRWGIMGSSLGGTTNLGVRTTYVEVRTYEA
jgi:hypothetical protein